MKTDTLKDIYKKFNLAKDDIFVLKIGGRDKYIICRSGIEKIQAQLHIDVKYELKKISEDFKSCVVLGTGALMKLDKATGQKRPVLMAQSFGECTPLNNKNSYPVCMAEKRSLSRIILKLSGLASEGIYGEDEAEDFKR
jgi:bifunctional DNA-binding transcriptional regulator/antitoxin component of YhaV-PrlF toxin-antitoxin module